MKKKLAEVSAVMMAVASEGAMLEKAQLDAMLEELANSTPPPIADTVAMMATCYVMAIPETGYEVFLCPKCGARTYHVGRSPLGDINFLKRCAEELREKGLDIATNETEFCATCTPLKTEPHPTRARIKETNEVVEILAIPSYPSSRYTVRRPNGKAEWVRGDALILEAEVEMVPSKTCPMAKWIYHGRSIPYKDGDDRLLEAFLDKKPTVKLSWDSNETPLKNHLPRLRQLLGVDLAPQVIEAEGEVEIEGIDDL